MKQFAIQNVVVPSHDEISVVCPKPRRLGLFNFPVNDHPDSDFDVEWPVAASSPPFFCGSPPSRATNPLTQDARFGDETFSPAVSPLSPQSWVVVPTASGLPPSPSSSARKGGCVRANFGNNPAVRVEGFDCLDRDRRNCSIPALA